MNPVMSTPVPAGKLSVVMPVYNEEKTIAQIVDMVLSRPEVGELIIVDDASKDNSWEKLLEIAKSHGVKE